MRIAKSFQMLQNIVMYILLMRCIDYVSHGFKRCAYNNLTAVMCCALFASKNIHHLLPLRRDDTKQAL